jgi:hypothetical protein
MAGKLTRKPKSPASVDAFIAGAGQNDMASNNIIPFQWEETWVREDVLKVYNLRLPEPYLLKLKYIAEHSPESMQQFCLGVLLPAIDEKIEELTGPGKP